MYFTFSSSLADNASLRCRYSSASWGLWVGSLRVVSDQTSYVLIALPSLLCAFPLQHFTSLYSFAFLRTPVT
ncbi:hypothetical protein BDQ12DRAFT_684340 [Crucibulum laeve]|uniref:Uncharacterized protein n=1 Tax=Crucibulum laeve TaxID=68775 RepID=A0A5C3LYY6_9AGAR|nr:hypothetical protein BDQ12DRAFT_684340 [Crucibulum laeve]